MGQATEESKTRVVTVWPPRRRIVAESAWAVAVIGVLYLLLVALNVWGTYSGQSGRVDTVTGEYVDFDAGAAWSSSFSDFPGDLFWPGLWWAGTTVCLLVLSGRFVLRAGARAGVAGLIALAASAPSTFAMLRYMVVYDGWGGGPAGLGLIILVATPVIGACVWATAIAIRSVPLLVRRARALNDWAS